MSSNKFEFTSKQKQTFLALIIAGVVLAVIGMVTGAGMDRFWSNFLLDTIFFLGISLLAIFFLAAHQIAIAGWHLTIKRVPEAMTQFAKYGAVCMLIVIIGVWGGYHHLYHWNNDFIVKEHVTQSELDAYVTEHEGESHEGHNKDYGRTWQKFQYNQPAEQSHEEGNSSMHETEHVNVTPVSNETSASGEEIKNPFYDKLIDGKSSYLNKYAWTLRALIYITLWLVIAHQLRKFSLQEDLDSAGNTKWYMKSKTWAAFFLIIWAVSSSMMAWDWVMSLDPHWYSTLFGWYNFISLWVASICTTILILLYLKRKGYMAQVNENHLHNLGLYAFGFSVFWTYLWFSQFMLYWYGNIPEETRWFLDRARTDYRPLFYANLFLNFFLPFLVLLRRDAKRNFTVLAIVASCLILSHWLDFFMMIMPATVGEGWGLGVLELGMFLTFAGFFLYIVFSELAKASLIPEKHPFYKESLDHHI